MQALREIEKTLHAQLAGMGKPLDVAAVKREVMQEPGHRRRLAGWMLKKNAPAPRWTRPAWDWSSGCFTTPLP